MSLTNLPVLILAFNRSDHFQSCLSSIYSQGIRNIYVSLDGPRDTYDKQMQEQMNKVIYKYSKDCYIKVKRSTKNKGCRLGVITGIDWFFDQVNAGVIIEDDVMLSNKCIEGFEYLLNKYSGSNNVMSISSHCEFSKENIGSISFLPVFRAWGWASWRDKWQIHKEFSKKLHKLSIRRIYELFPDFYKNILNARKIKSCQMGLLDTWDYEFNLTHISLSYYSLTLNGINIKNVGFGENSTHTKELKDDLLIFTKLKENNIDFNKISKINKYSNKQLVKSTGIHTINNNIKDERIINYIYSYWISFVFLIRKLKRYILNTIKKKNPTQSLKNK